MAKNIFLVMENENLMNFDDFFPDGGDLVELRHIINLAETFKGLYRVFILVNDPLSKKFIWAYNTENVIGTSRFDFRNKSIEEMANCHAYAVMEKSFREARFEMVRQQPELHQYYCDWNYPLRTPDRGYPKPSLFGTLFKRITCIKRLKENQGRYVYILFFIEDFDCCQPMIASRPRIINYKTLEVDQEKSDLLLSLGGQRIVESLLPNNFILQRIIELKKLGDTNKEIAQKLGFSYENTIKKKYMSELRKKVIEWFTPVDYPDAAEYQIDNSEGFIDFVRAMNIQFSKGRV